MCVSFSFSISGYNPRVMLHPTLHLTPTSNPLGRRVNSAHKVSLQSFNCTHGWPCPLQMLCSTLCNPMVGPQGWPTWPPHVACQASLYPQNFPHKNTGVGCHALLQGIFPTQGWHTHFLVSWIGRQILYHQHHLESLSIRILSPKRSSCFYLAPLQTIFFAAQRWTSRNVN